MKLKNLTEKYEIIEQVGEGTYGKVYKGKCLETGKLVALKKFRIETEKEGFSITAVREIKILQNLCHGNIVQMQEITMAPPPDKDVFIVFDYLEHDLSGLMKSEIGMKMLRDERKGEIVIKGLMHQLVMGLGYLHNEAGVIHRDMKGSNILIDKYGRLKLADFGLARSIQGSSYDGCIKESGNILPIMTNRVITLWFRPPEVLLGDDTYGPEVDIWGLGCIFAELFTGKPIFAGSDEISQLEAILIGLNEEQENAKEPLRVLANLPWYKLIPPCLREGYQATSPNLRERLKESQITKEASQLLFSMLQFDPKKRITCREALKSAYFSECGKKEFYEYYRRIFETGNFFNLELKSSEPRQQ